MDSPSTSKTSSTSSTLAKIPRTSSSHANKDKVESLLNAARVGDLDKVVEILKDVHIDSKDRWGETALHKATRNGNLEVCQLLVNRRCDINAVDRFGQTALHRAALCGHAKICSLLLESGCPIDVKDDTGDTPLMDACIMGRIDTVEILLQKGGNLELQNKKGESALHMALKNGHLEIAEKINLDKQKFTLEVSAEFKVQQEISDYLAKVGNKRDSERKDDALTPITMSPMSTGTLDYLLEDDITDQVESNVPVIDNDSSQPSTSGHFSPIDLTVPRNTPLETSTITRSSEDKPVSTNIENNDTRSIIEHATVYTSAKDHSNEGSMVEQLQHQQAAGKRKYVEIKQLEGLKKPKLSEEGDQIKQQSDEITEKHLIKIKEENCASDSEYNRISSLQDKAEDGNILPLRYPYELMLKDYDVPDPLQSYLTVIYDDSFRPPTVGHSSPVEFSVPINTQDNSNESPTLAYIERIMHQLDDERQQNTVKDQIIAAQKQQLAEYEKTIKDLEQKLNSKRKQHLEITEPVICEVQYDRKIKEECSASQSEYNEVTPVKSELSSQAIPVKQEVETRPSNMQEAMVISSEQVAEDTYLAAAKVDETQDKLASDIKLEPDMIGGKHSKLKNNENLDRKGCCELSNVGGLFRLKDMDVVLYIPKNAIEKRTNLEISQSDSSDEDAVSYEYRLSPHGLTFNQAVVIRIPLMMKDQCNLYSLGIKYTNTEMHEANQWCTYPLQSDEIPGDIPFIIWGGYCYLFMKHFCGFYVCKNCKAEDCAYQMYSYLFVKYQPEPRKASFLTSFSGTEEDKPIVEDLKKKWGEPIKKESFVLYRCSENVSVEVTFDEGKWHCTSRRNKYDLDVNKLLPNDQNTKKPQLEYYLTGKGQRYEDTHVEVVICQEGRLSTPLNWNPYWDSSHPEVNQNGFTERIKVAKDQESSDEKPYPHLPSIEIEDELQPLCDHLEKDKNHLRQIAQDIGALISKGIQPMHFLQIWFVMKCCHMSQELKQQTIWIELVKKLCQCGHFEEYKMLMWIIQKKHLKEQIVGIYKSIQEYPMLHTNCAKINLIDEEVKEELEEVNNLELKKFVLLEKVVCEKPVAYDTLVEFLVQTNQEQIEGRIKLKKLPTGCHVYILEEMVKRNKDSLIGNMTQEIIVDLMKANMIAAKNRKTSSLTPNIVVEDLQHVLSSVNFGTFLGILCRHGLRGVVEELRSVYLDCGGREEFCAVKYEDSEEFCSENRTLQGLFAHKADYKLTKRDYENIPQLMQYVCAVFYHLPRTFNGTGLFLGFVEPVSSTNSLAQPFTVHSKITEPVAVILISRHILEMSSKNVQHGELIFDWYDRFGGNELKSSSSGVIAEDDTLDYALLFTSDSNVISRFQNVPHPRHMVTTNIPSYRPLKDITMTLLGHPRDSPMQGDHIEIIDKQTILNNEDFNRAISVAKFSARKGTNLHIVEKPFSVIYNCSSFHGASGAPCFILSDGKVELTCIHGGGIFLNQATPTLHDRSDFEYGTLMSYILNDINGKLPNLGLQWIN